MDRQRLNRITALFLVIVVLVIALMLTGSLRRPAQVVLPEASDAPGGTGADPGGNSLTVVEVRPDTVQAAIATLARPEEYRRTVSVEQFWTGGSGTVETTATVSGAWTRTDRTLADGRVRHAVTDGETTYLWYNEAPPVLTLPAGSVTADAEQMIPTYETVLALPVERIGILPEEEKKKDQDQQVSGVHVVQVQQVQNMPEKAGEAVGKGAAPAAGRRVLSRGSAAFRRGLGWRSAGFRPLRPRRRRGLMSLPGGGRGILRRDAGIGTVVAADIAVVHPSSLPSGQKSAPQVEQPGQLQGALHLFLPLGL